MEASNTSKEDTAVRLARVGARFEFALQRFAYLRQHPDGQSGRPLLFDNAVAFSMTLMLGILLDLLLDVRDGALPQGKDFDVEMTPDGMDLTIRIRRVPDESRPGYKLDQEPRLVGRRES